MAVSVFVSTGTIVLLYESLQRPPPSFFPGYPQPFPRHDSGDGTAFPENGLGG